MKHFVWSAAVIVSALVLTSCSSINPDSLPQPGKTYSGGYDVVVEFENVLNLPERAKVVMDGKEVGVVTGVEVDSREVNVTVRIAPGIQVPANIHAALQQATVLGDIYVTLERPQGEAAAPPLDTNGRIPLAQTTSPPQLEDTIAHLANFVSSGSIQRLQNTIIGVNRVQPPGGQPEIRRMAAQVATDLADLSNNIDTTDMWLDGVRGTTDVLHTRLPSAEYWFSPRGMRGLDRATDQGADIAKVLASVGSVYTDGFWLVPLLKSLADATGALQQSKWNFEQEYPAWRKLFTDSFLPQDKYPAINITSIVGPDGRELSADVADVLRILGAAP